jgi:hypothetical protein
VLFAHFHDAGVQIRPSAAARFAIHEGRVTLCDFALLAVASIS